MTPRWDFFVSYAAADHAWAEWIAWELEEAGYRVLFQEWDFVPGSHWTTRMREGIKHAERTLAILSPAYLDSVYGQMEWQAALRADPRGLARKLIPVRIADCERPDVLGEVVAFDLFGIDAEGARRWLLDRISAALAGRVKPVDRPLFPGGQTADATPPQLDRPSTAPEFPGTADARRHLTPARAVVGVALALAVAVIASGTGGASGTGANIAGVAAATVAASAVVLLAFHRRGFTVTLVCAAALVGAAGGAVLFSDGGIAAVVGEVGCAAALASVCAAAIRPALSK